MAAEREIKTVLTLDDASFSRGLKAATNSVSAARAEMQASIASANGLAKGLKKYGAQVSGLKKTLKAEKQQMAVLKKEYDIQKKKLAEASKALKESKKDHEDNSEEVKKAANAYAATSAQVDDLRVKMARLSSQMSQDKNTLTSSVTAPLKSLGSTLGKTAVAYTALLATAGAALIALGQKSRQAANELSMSINESETTFGAWSKLIEQEADKAWKNLGLSKSAYLTAAADIGNFLQEAGAPVRQSAELSAQVLEMAGRISQEYGVPVAQVLDDIKAAANGSATAMNKYGIRVTAATVQQTSMTYGIGKTYEQLTDEEKQLLAVKTMLDQSKEAQETYKNKTNEISSSVSSLKAAWENWLAGAGTADDVISAFSGVADSVSQNITAMVPTLTAGITELIGAFVSELPNTLTTLGPSLEELLSGILSMLTENADEIGSAAGRLAGTLATFLVENAPKLVESAATMVESFLKSFVASFYMTWKSETWPAIQKFFKATLGIDLPDWNMVVNQIRNLWDKVKGGVKNAAMFVVNFALSIKEKAAALVNRISALWSDVKKGIENAAMFVVSFAVSIKTKAEALVNRISALWSSVKKGVEDAAMFVVSFAMSIKEKAADAFSRISAWWSNVKSTIAEKGLFSAVFQVLTDAWNTVSTAISNWWDKEVWPHVTAAFQATFRVVTDAWYTVSTAISNWWDKDVWPHVTAAFQATFRVVTDAWYTVSTAISNWWDKDVWPHVTAAFQATFRVVMDAWNTVSTAISNWWEKDVWPHVTAGFQATFRVVTDAWNTVSTAISNWWDQDVWPHVTAAFQATFRVVTDAWNTVSTAISNWWDQDVWPNIKAPFQATFRVVTDAWNTVSTAISNWWDKDVWPNIKAPFQAVFSVIGDTWENVQSTLLSWWYQEDGIGARIRDEGLLAATAHVIGEGWDRAKKAVTDWWSGEGGIADQIEKDGLLTTAFRVVGDAWDNLKSTVSTWWSGSDGNGGIAGKIREIAKTTLGIELPKWSDIESRWNTFWANVLSHLPTWLLDLLDFLGINTGRSAAPEQKLTGTDLPPAARDLIEQRFNEKAEENLAKFIQDYVLTPMYSTDFADDLQNEYRKLYQIANRDGVLAGMTTEQFARFRQLMPKEGEEITEEIAQKFFDLMNEIMNSQETQSTQVRQSTSRLTDALDGAASALQQFSASLPQLVPGLKTAGGNWDVPFDNYLAALHRGEMVLTADQARRYRAAAASGGNTYNDSASIYIDKYNQYSGADADALLQQMQMMQRRQRMGYGLA